MRILDIILIAYVAGALSMILLGLTVEHFWGELPPPDDDEHGWKSKG